MRVEYTALVQPKLSKKKFDLKIEEIEKTLAYIEKMHSEAVDAQKLVNINIKFLQD